ncbi:DNA primase [Phytohabitans sp. ZYX-F-186]|uniref:DNA primase n=1 Tax=Phytohabitans maris TaxID=3071409 RepID=A0ABU0ZSM5_9ACTN|nr:DNA primase [Phytohabitans sp. ZYX-F-186]MDQ7910035.1 DNA primase [Phytohabitans sp. ZYX-F-186]
MARQSPNRPDADKPEPDLEIDEDLEEVDEEEEAEAEDASSGGPSSLWADTRIDPVEIALPSGVGYTLRAYRLSTSLTPTDIGDRDEDDPFAAKARHAMLDDDDDTVVILDDDFPGDEDEEDAEEAKRRGRHARDDSGSDSDDSDSDSDSDDSDSDSDSDEADEPSAEDFEDEEEEEEEAPAEEVPVFLSHRGKLLLFKSPESLVTFVRSGAPNDLAQVDGWAEVVERIQPADVAPSDDDSYELDLVVENLRGGHDTWDFNLLIEAGEAARDLSYALRLTPVLTALSPGSPLDDLDEALRSAAGGGIGAFRGRRRLKKIGAQQASLGWRTIIGKISAAVDWRD